MIFRKEDDVIIKGQKFISIFLVVLLITILFVPAISAHTHEDISVSDEAEHESNKGKHNKEDSKKGHYGGKGGKEDHSTHTESEDGEDGDSGNGDDKKGGVGSGGSGKGGQGNDNKKGGKHKDDAGGTITLVVTVEGLVLDKDVDVILTREEIETVKRTVDGEVTFYTEASGDCWLAGEPVPGYITPSKKISLTGDVKFVEETLTYVEGNIPVEGVTLNKNEIELISGYSEQLIAIIEPANANNQEVSWISSDSNIANVIDGLVTGVSTGTANITVTTEEGDKSSVCDVTVVSIISLVQPEQITALKNEIVIFPLKVEAKLDNNTFVEIPVVWKDDAGEIYSSFQVPLDNPNDTYSFKGYVQGTDLITTLTIDVDKAGRPAVPVVKVEIVERNEDVELKAMSLYVDEKYELKEKIYPEDATNKYVIWKSSNTDVATVEVIIEDNEEYALLTAKSPGIAVITVETVDGGHKAYCQVAVSIAPEVSLIYPTLEGGVIGEHFDTREEVYINVENLVTKLLDDPEYVEKFDDPDNDNPVKHKHYFVKVEQKGSNPILGEGEYIITPETKEFNLYNVTEFNLTENYSNEYFVSMSTDPRYPKDNEKTLKTNFKIGTAVPTIPKENITVNLEIYGGYREQDPQGIIFLLCRELDKELSDITWKDYYDGHPPDNPYNPNVELKFIDEVKMRGKTKIVNEDGDVKVIWDEPRETLKLGGYILLEVTPNGYTDNLNLVNPESEDGELLKAVHLTRDGYVERLVINTFTGDEHGNGENGTDDYTNTPRTTSTKISSDAEKIEEIEGMPELVNHWAREYVIDLVKKDLLRKKHINNLNKSIITDELSNVFKLAIDHNLLRDLNILETKDIMTRQEIVKLLMLAFGFGESDNLILDFLDSNEIDEDYLGYVAKAYELEIIMGYEDGTYRPNKIVSKAEIYAMISRCLQKIN